MKRKYHHYQPLGIRWNEVWFGAMRIKEFLENTTPPTVYKDIQWSMGLSYRQTVEAIDMLKQLGVVDVTYTAVWNGCHYIYPHRVWLTHPE